MFEILNIEILLGKPILITIFHFYFLAKDFSHLILKLFRGVKNITLEGTVSQIFFI